jgi:hypothetical protein
MLQSWEYKVRYFCQFSMLSRAEITELLSELKGTLAQYFCESSLPPGPLMQTLAARISQSLDIA